ncbi:hypothetical protein GIB67_035584 [Kingdonia uniflora]|uniref:Pentatricopeptide repeat-containing protein n=1 Tax=Kingdonia uniflora TaxID=39325 RepID=A0A7J7LD54_9MAGN|nr:hypothetical protein GIB67_035584 [Kingdonia uniflora]
MTDILGYAKKGMMVNARELFDDMVERNVVSWTAMVAGYANSGDITSAKELFDEMPVRNSVTWTAMIAGYGKCGDVIKAVEVFDQIPACDHSAWAAMITCYGHNGYAREAIEMYKRMRKLNVKADEVSLVGLISACTQIGDVEMGNSIADQMEESSCNQSPVVSNALIHMHAKCGSIDGALNEFKNMFEKDVVSYSALITALADHGRANEALELFSRMQKDGVEPNQVTFVGVLNACSHAGLVHEGRKYFEMMTNIHGISPSTEHFACMVDILGRAGHIEEAYKLITDNVGIIDTGVNSSSRASQGLHRLREGGVWGALLGACRVHGNVELGEIAAKHLFEIEPENTGNYLLLASIYTSANRWDDAARMRKMMCEIGIQKSPGRSWVSNKD